MTEPSRAVFLSYASEDAEAAQRIAQSLRASGIEVWFDKSELRGGDTWDRQIRQQIHDCRLFIAMVSAHTEARDEGYFRREWRLAVERAGDMAEGRAFVVPVVIDGTTPRSTGVRVVQSGRPRMLACARDVTRAKGALTQWAKLITVGLMRAG